MLPLVLVALVALHLWAARWEHLKVAFSQQMSCFGVSLSFHFDMWI